MCGRCGTRMTVRYHQRGGHRIVPDYLCQRDGIARGAEPCQRVPGHDLDAAVSGLLVEMVTPESIAAILSIQDELLARAADAERLRQRQVERAQYEADLAQRRYLRVDPDNRLVADVLEAAWNARLRVLAAAREAAEEQRQRDQICVSETEREVMLRLPRDFVAIWQDPHVPTHDRKRIMRFLIEDVTVQKEEQIVAQLRFKGGASRTITVPLPPPFAHSRLTSTETLGEIDRLLDHHTDAEVAAELNAQGHRTFAGLPFHAACVSALRRRHGLKDHATRLREAGMLTADELAGHLGVTPQTIYRWHRRHRIPAARCDDRGVRVFAPPTTPLMHRGTGRVASR